MLRRLVLGILILASSGVAQDAFAARFGLQTGFYNESIKTPCASSREFGLRLGFYADKTTNDILYASAVNGTNICGTGGCGVAPAPLAAPVDCGCAAAAPPLPAPIPGYLPPPGCATSAMAIRPTGCGCSNNYAAMPTNYPVVQTAAPSTKTEIYLLVLPDNKPNYQPQAPVYHQAPPMADYRRAAPQGYYREPEYQEPVRGLW